MAFSEVGISLEFEGEGVNEIARVSSCFDPDYFIAPGTVVIAVDRNYFRPTEVELLIGDPAKARIKLGWEPKHSVGDIVKDMMQADLKLFERDKLLLSNGMEILKYDE
jgi:GDPmannose 4,6-dehydratase